MSSSTHDLTLQATGRIEVPSNENSPCCDIQITIAEVLTMLSGDHGVQVSPSSL